MPKKKKVDSFPDFARTIWEEFLRLFAVVFKFVLELLKISNTFVRTFLGVVVLALSATLIAAFSLYLVMTAFGVRDSAVFQEHRDTLLNEAWEIRMESVERHKKYNEEKVEATEVETE